MAADHLPCFQPGHFDWQVLGSITATVENVLHGVGRYFIVLQAGEFQ
ncbi:MAG TPA: hypothetical protein PK820_01730 [Candidatus Competibacteraceae bacterium]|nr:hypothetical protein [Candidatus Competibacteraceae bacterium]HPF57491.1 hypothetical protein [Candidatus Competibacteraceae bacterium]